MTTSGASSILSFLFIIALIPVALWLLKRSKLAGVSTAGPMRSIAVLPLSPGQRIMTIEVGTGAERRWLVLGVTPQQITTLHSMAPQEELPASGEQQTISITPFAQLLDGLRGKRPGGPA
jgi:flagellar protein FliO/FliZ